MLPARNRRDLEEIPEKVRADLKFHYVDHMDAVLPLALLEGPRPSPAYAGVPASPA